MITPEMIEQLKAQYSGETQEKKQTVPELIDDIKENHHEKELEMIDDLLGDIKSYEENTYNIKENSKDVFGVFRHMAFELRKHFEKEEFMVFPMMLEKYSDQVAGYTDNAEDVKIMLKINELESEHAKAEGYIADIEKVSGNYTYDMNDIKLGEIFSKMQKLFVDISEHEGKENGELFPRFI